MKAVRNLKLYCWKKNFSQTYGDGRLATCRLIKVSSETRFHIEDQIDLCLTTLNTVHLQIEHFNDVAFKS